MLLIEKMEHIEKLSNSQQSVVDYMLEQKQRIREKTAKEIAMEVYTSAATLTRLAQRLGYKGFDELKHDFLREQEYLDRNTNNIDANLPFYSVDGYLTIANRIGNLMKETIDDTLCLINQKALYQAVDYIVKANTIHIAAISFPLLYAKDFQLKMRRLGKKVELTELTGEQLYTYPIIEHNDIAIMISYSGEIPLLKEMATMYKEKGLSIIAITSLGENSIRNKADVVLEITTRERLYSKIAEFSTQTSMKLMLDILYSCYFQTNYAKFLRDRKELGKRAEPGRFSTSHILDEE
ncbi:MurR/RpiR family transcriptional regulator [Amedibacillus sp. YH-ame6]